MTDLGCAQTTAEMLYLKTGPLHSMAETTQDRTVMPAERLA